MASFNGHRDGVGASSGEYVVSRLDQVALIPRVIKADARGWFLKVINGLEENLPSGTGEVYLTMAMPGHVRGNHYHKQTAEWFTVVSGKAHFKLYDPTTNKARELWLDAATPATIYVPAGIAHAFKNPAEAEEIMLLVAYADRIYDAEDTVPLKLL